MDTTIGFAKALHSLSTIIWVGGMFFAFVILRPVAVNLLAAPERLALWAQTFSKFFLWVWCAVILLPATGFWMIFNVFNDFGELGMHIHIMTMLGLIMILIFLYVFFIPYLQFRLAMLSNELQKAAKHLNQIRIAIGINLSLGLITTVLGTSGRYFL